MADAANRAAFGHAQKRGLVPLHQMHQLRRAQTVALVKVRQGAALRELVPRADQLTVVAAVNAVAHQGAQLQRYRPVVLYGQVGNAATRIQLVRRDDGLRRASADTGIATAAVIADRFTGCERHVDKNFTQKEKRTGLALQHQRVFAAPAQATFDRQLGFEHRRRIGEHTVSQRPGDFLQLMRQLLQSLAHHLVVVTPSGVHRNDGFAGLLQARKFAAYQVIRGAGW